MSYGFIDEQYLSDIANAIREKNRTDTRYTPGEMASAIENLTPPAQLYAPTIFRSDDTLTITNSSDNGAFVQAYNVYDNDSLVSVIHENTFDLLSLGYGYHEVTVTAYSDNMMESERSNTEYFNTYMIKNELNNLYNENTNDLIIEGSQYVGRLQPESGYYLPTNIDVSISGNRINFNYDNDSGYITIPSQEVIGDITIFAYASEYPRLEAPSISLAGDILSWSAISGADSYSLIYNDSEVYSTSLLSIDLTTIFNESGTYALTVIAKGSNYQNSNPSNSVEYIIDTNIYGVAGLYDSSPNLIRTDDAVNLTFAINSSTGAVSSDFDSRFPWNKATIETISGNTLLHLPDMWFRVGVDGNSRITDIAVSSVKGYGENWYKVDSFYYGCYGSNAPGGSKVASKSGKSRYSNDSREVFRVYSSNVGRGFFQLDLYHHTVMQFLWLIEWATKDSQSIMTGRIATYGNTAVNTGGTDNLTTPSGFDTTTGQMRYHYIEDFVGNLLEWIDGYSGDSMNEPGKYYATTNPNKFTESISGLNLLSYVAPTTSGNNIAALGWDIDNPFMALPIETVSNTGYNTYFCDYCGKTTYPDPVSGASYIGSSNQNGVHYIYQRVSNTSETYIGGRLLYKS